MKAKGVSDQILKVLKSWLEIRKSVVLVGGQASRERTLSNMVYQGTVWGPPLWNSFFEDARKAVASNEFSETAYADDLIAFRGFFEGVSHAILDAAMLSCQSDLRRWGEANQVTFDPAKESFHIISRHRPKGTNFVELGVEFDCRLIMRDAVHQCAVEAGWKIKCVLRPQRYFTTTETVKLYLSHVLSFIEYRTPAIAHAAPSILVEIDQLQNRFLRALDISEEEALIHFRLAPLAVRRQIAILGVIHRCNLKQGPPQLWSFFERSNSVRSYNTRSVGRSHDRRLVERAVPCQPVLFQRSAFGGTRAYNLLPRWIAHSPSVKTFQRNLQKLVCLRAEAGREDWKDTLCWTRLSSGHPLVSDSLCHPQQDH